MVSGLGAIVLDPYREYKLAATKSLSVGGGSSPIEAALTASAKSIGRVPTTFLKNAAVDVPVAVADSFRSMARSCGDQVRDHGPVTDWKSGVEVAGKVRSIVALDHLLIAYDVLLKGLVTDVYDSLTGIVMQPYRGAKKDGVLGAVKGFGGWMIGTPTKTCGCK